VFTVLADFICSGILFQIGALSDCRVGIIWLLFWLG